MRKRKSLRVHRLALVERAFDAAQLTERVERSRHLALVALRARQRQRFFEMNARCR